MSSENPDLGAELRDAFARDQVVAALCDEVSGKDGDALERLWLEGPGEIAGRARSQNADVLCETNAGARRWVEAKRGPKPNDAEVLDDIEKMYRAFLQRRLSANEKPGDDYAFCTPSEGADSPAWKAFERALTCVGGPSVQDLDRWVKRVRHRCSKPATQTAEQIHSVLRAVPEGNDRNALDFLQRLELFPTKISDKERGERLCGADVVRDAKEAGSLLRLLQEHLKRTVHGPALEVADFRATCERQGIAVRLRARIERALESLRGHAGALPGLGFLHQEHPEWRIERKRLLAGLKEKFQGRPVLVTGEAGTGKSTLLVELAREAGDENAILLRASLFAHGSPRALEKALLDWDKNEVSFEQVVRAWPVARERYLLVDGLDEASHKDAYRRLGELSRLARVIPNLHLVFAARTPDLDYFKEDLGVECAEFCVPELTDAELDALTAGLGSIAPRYARALGDSRLRALVRNPRRLGLLVNILERAPEVETSTLWHEAALLGTYWDAMCRRHGMDDLLLQATRIADWMWFHGADELGRLEMPSDWQQPTKLLSEGVLITDRDRYRFSSRTFLDYAFARAIEQGGSAKGFSAWIRGGRYDFRLIDVLRYRLGHRKSRGRPPEDAHSFVAAAREALIGHGVPAIFRVAAARALADLVDMDDATPAMALFQEVDARSRALLLGHFLATRVQLVERLDQVPEVDRQIARWLATDGVEINVTATVSYLRAAAGHAASPGDHETAAALAQAMQQVWASLHAKSPVERPDLAELLVEPVCTLAALLGSDVAAWLDQVVRDPLQVADEVAEHLPRLAKANKTAVVQAWFALMSRAEDDGPPRPMGPSRVLVLTLDPGSELQLLRKHCADVVETLLDAAPAEMTEAVVRRVEALAEERGGTVRDTTTRHAEDALVCREDMSYSWASRRRREQNDDLRSLGALEARWKVWLSASEHAERLQDSLQAIQRVASCALVWTSLLEVVALHLQGREGAFPGATRPPRPLPDATGSLILRFLTDPAHVRLPSIHVAAGQALRVLGDDARWTSRVAEIAQAHLARARDSAERSPDRHGLGRALVCLRESANPQLHVIGEQAEVICGCSTVRPLSAELEREFLRVPTDPEPAAVPQFAGIDVQLAEELQRALVTLVGEPTATNSDALVASALSLTTSDTTSDPDSRRLRERSLVRAAAAIVEKWKNSSETSRAWARSALFGASTSADPDAPTDESVRLDLPSDTSRAIAARGLAWLASYVDLRPEERERLRALATDPAPQVRAELAREMVWLQQREPDLLWELARQVSHLGASDAATDQDATIVGELLDRLSRFLLPEAAAAATEFAQDLWSHRADLRGHANAPWIEARLLGLVTGLWIHSGDETAERFVLERLDDGGVTIGLAVGSCALEGLKAGLTCASDAIEGARGVVQRAARLLGIVLQRAYALVERLERGWRPKPEEELRDLMFPEKVAIHIGRAREPEDPNEGSRAEEKAADILRRLELLPSSLWEALMPAQLTHSPFVHPRIRHALVDLAERVAKGDADLALRILEFATPPGDVLLPIYDESLTANRVLGLLRGFLYDPNQHVDRAALRQRIVRIVERFAVARPGQAQVWLALFQQGD